jgi:hypothetical protein
MLNLEFCGAQAPGGLRRSSVLEPTPENAAFSITRCCTLRSLMAQFGACELSVDSHIFQVRLNPF